MQIRQHDKSHPFLEPILVRLIKYWNLCRARNIDSQRTQRWPGIQVQLNRVGLDRLLIVSQMLAILDTAVARNLERQDGILVRAEHQSEEGSLFDTRLHRYCVLARFQHQVRQQGIANRCPSDAEVHCHVAQVERHDGGVGDVHGAEHVGAVGEDFFRAGKDLQVGDVEAGEVVQACDAEVRCDVSDE